MDVRELGYRLTYAYGCYRTLLQRCGVKVPTVHVVADLG